MDEYKKGWIFGDLDLGEDINNIGIEITNFG